MSEFEKDLNKDVSENDDAVEVFDDFEMNGPETDSAEDVSADDIENSELAVVEAIEEAETAAEEAAEIDTEAEDTEEAAEAQAEETEEAAEAEAEEAEEAAETEAEEAEEAAETEAEETEEAAETEAEEAEEAAETEAEEAEEAAETEAEEAEEAAETEAEEAEEAAEAEAEEAEEAAETEAKEATETETETEEATETEAEADEVSEIMADEAEQVDNISSIDEPEEDENRDEEADGSTETADSEEIDIMSSIQNADDEDGAEELSDGSDDGVGLETLAGEVALSEDESENEAGDATVDEDDYLDYDDSPKQKKIVSGKAAVITMVTTCVVTICLIAGVFWLGVTMKRDIGISLVSYSDRFNVCDTRTFEMSKMLGFELISMSDADMTLSTEDFSNLKKGKTVSKFNDLVNISVQSRFGKIVSMDITFDEKLNELDNPSAGYMLLLGNALSGLFDAITTSDVAFMAAYNVLVTGASPAPSKGSDVYVFTSDNLAIYADYSKMAETQKRSDVSIHVENSDPDYIKADKLDFSWIPFDFSSDKQTTVQKPVVSSSEISPTDE